MRMAKKINAYNDIVVTNNNWCKLNSGQRATVKKGGRIKLDFDPYKEKTDYEKTLVEYIIHLKDRKSIL